MSLVNLSHVCSHLQNASLARLGLTSIPYTRLHLSLSLLLQKEGFLSQVKLAGLSPPASCFPPGSESNKYANTHSLSELTEQSSPNLKGRTPEAALSKIVKEGGAWGEADLRRIGFGDEAVEFALRHRDKKKSQLETEQWDVAAAVFLLKHQGKSEADLRQTLAPEDVQIILSHADMLQECKETVEATRMTRAQFEEQEEEAMKQGLRRRRNYDWYTRQLVYEEMLRRGFDVETLRHFAGERRFVTQRELNLNGIDIDAMGLTVENQPFSPPPPKHLADPWQMEEEGVVTQANRASRRLWLGMKYWDGVPVLRKARMLSKPTKRIKLDASELSRLVRGRAAGEVKPLTQVGEIMAVQTSMGVKEIRECVERKLGGMVLCRIW